MQDIANCTKEENTCLKNVLEIAPKFWNCGLTFSLGKGWCVELVHVQHTKPSIQFVKPLL